MNDEDSMREKERHRMKVLFERADIVGFDNKEDSDFVNQLKEREITMIRQLGSEERVWVLRLEHEMTDPQDYE